MREEKKTKREGEEEFHGDGHGHGHCVETLEKRESVGNIALLLIMTNSAVHRTYHYRIVLMNSVSFVFNVFYASSIDNT